MDKLNQKFDFNRLADLPLLNIEAETIVVYNGVVQEELSTIEFSGVFNITESNFTGRPIHLINISDESRDDYALLMMNIFSGIEVNLMTSYICLPNSSLKSKVVLNVSDGALLNHCSYFNLHKGASLKRVFDVNIQENAKYDAFMFLKNLGEFDLNISANIIGKDSSLSVDGLYNIAGESKAKIVFEGEHLSSNTDSDILFKGIADDEAQILFELGSLAAKDISDVKISQYHKALLLSNSAKVKAKPDLKIFTEDVEAAHGFTISSFDKEMMFFLKNRGCSEVEAKKLLREAFAMEIFNKIKREKLRELLIEKVL